MVGSVCDKGLPEGYLADSILAMGARGASKRSARKELSWTEEAMLGTESSEEGKGMIRNGSHDDSDAGG